MNLTGVYILALSILALATAIVVYPTLKYGPKEEKRKVKKVVKKTSRPKSSKKKK